MDLTEIFKKTPVKWIIVLYGVYIIGRAVRTLFEPGYAGQIVETSMFQFSIYELNFDWLSLSFLHPLVFAVLSVDVIRRSYPFKFFVTVVTSHCVALLFAGWQLMLPFIGNPNQDLCDISPEMLPNPSLCEANWENIGIVFEEPSIKGLAIFLAAIPVLILSIIWWRRPIQFFSEQGSNSPKSDAQTS